MVNSAYMPILKGKQGELWALRDQGHLRGVLPVIEIPRIKWNYDADTPAKTIGGHVADFLRRFEPTLTSLGTCAVDGALLDGGSLDDSSVALDATLRRAESLDLLVTPTTGLVRPASYQRVASEYAERYGTGCVLRVEKHEVYDGRELKAAIEAFLGEARLLPEKVDLVVDFGSLREEDEADDLDLSMRSIPEIPHLSRWRSLWFAGGSFPEFLTHVDADSTQYIPRVEWTIWNSLAIGLRSSRLPLFADYGIAHPISPEVDGRVMNMSANARYTTEDHWLVVKGKNTRSHGYGQFASVCQKLVAAADYCGRTFSPGDAYFDDCASGDDGPGNATKWRQAGTSHHMAFAAAQVEKAERLYGHATR